jgi:hypothetical protein
MTKPSPGTRQVNLMLTSAQEKLVRLMVQRLREGGVEYEERVRLFVSEAPVPRYLHVDELDRRFGAIDRRFEALERQLREQVAGRGRDDTPPPE